MKCRAMQKVREDRTQALTRLYGTKCLEAIQQKAALLLLDRFSWFRRGDHLKQFFDGQAGAVEREVNENAAENVWIRDRRGRHLADEAEKFEEIVNDADYRLTRALRDGGINAERVYELAESGIPDKMFVGSDAAHLELRVCWYGWLGKRAIRTWLAGAGLSLLSFRLPGGRRRFPIRTIEGGILVPLASFASRWMTDFFGGSDRRQTQEAEARKRRLLDDYAVDLTPVSEQEMLLASSTETSAVIGDPKANDRSTSPAPEEYAKILAEIGRGFGKIGGRT